MNGRIKVLQVLGTLNLGGVESWLMNVLRTVDTGKFQFEFCTLGTEAGWHAVEAKRLGAVIHRCPRAPATTLGRRFRKILREGQFDVVHSHVHLFSGAILRWASLEHVGMRIAHSHTSHDEKSNAPGRAAYRRLMQHWIGRYGTHRLAASQQAARELFGSGSQSSTKAMVLHYGVDLRPFQRTGDRTRLRAELGIPQHARVAGHVGNFVEAKNHLLFLRIAAEVLRKHPDVHFLLVGHGPLQSAIEAEVKAMGLAERVHFAGPRTDVPELMQSCMDVLVFPSSWEGFGIAVVEAQAAGLPCIVSGAVSEETTIFPKRVFRLSVRDDVGEWAARIQEGLGLDKLDARVAARVIEESDYWIGRSCGLLMDLYAGSRRDRRDRNDTPLAQRQPRKATARVRANRHGGALE
jgi:glycosyltransferase involved in cell wall biosynthesis